MSNKESTVCIEDVMQLEDFQDLSTPGLPVPQVEKKQTLQDVGIWSEPRAGSGLTA